MKLGGGLFDFNIKICENLVTSGIGVRRAVGVPKTSNLIERMGFKDKMIKAEIA